MTLQEFKNKLNATRTDLSDTEIVVIAENGLELEPKLKYKLITGNMLNHSPENVEKIIITWD